MCNVGNGCNRRRALHASEPAVSLRVPPDKRCLLHIAFPSPLEARRKVWKSSTSCAFSRFGAKAGFN